MKKLISIILCLALCCGVLAITASAANTYYVAGAHVVNNDHTDPGPFGEAWNNAYPANAMSSQGNGIYTKTYYNVPAGEYQFKITDGTWENCWPGDNYVLHLDAAKDVTITFNSSTGEVGVSTSAPISNPTTPVVTAPEIVTMGVRGEGLEGLDWATDAIVMTEVTENFFEYTFENVSNATIKFKFAANNNWDDYNFGGAFQGSAMPTDAVWAGQDIEITVTDAANVCLQLDLTNFDYATKTGATFTVYVEAPTVDPTEEPTDPVEDPTDAIGSTDASEPTDADDKNDENNGGSGAGWIIGIVVAVLAVAAVVVFIIFRKKKQ